MPSADYLILASHEPAIPCLGLRRIRAGHFGRSLGKCRSSSQSTSSCCRLQALGGQQCQLSRLHRYRYNFELVPSDMLNTTQVWGGSFVLTFICLRGCIPGRLTPREYASCISNRSSDKTSRGSTIQGRARSLHVYKQIRVRICHLRCLLFAVDLFNVFHGFGSARHF